MRPPARPRTGLNHAGDCEFTREGCCCCLVSTHAGHYLNWDVGIAEATDLLIDGAVERGVAVVEPHHMGPLALPIDQQRNHLFQGECAGTNCLAVLGHQLRNLRADQGIGPDQYIGVTQTFCRPEREQISGSWTSSNEADRMGQLSVGSGSDRRR